MAIRVGVVGVGFMGKTHMSVYAKNKRAKLVGYADLDIERAKASFKTLGGNLGGGSLGFDPDKLTAYANPAKMFSDPNVDLVDICLPTYLHAEYIIKALTAGKHVLCEKPLSVDMKDAQRIAKAVKKARSLMMPAHCMRFWPEWAWLKQAVDSKRYGKVHSATFRRYASAPRYSANNWLMQPELSGAALFDLHVHDADFVRYVFGDPKAVFSVGNSGKITNGVDHVVSSYIYKNPRQLVVAEGGWNADPSYPFTMRYTVVFEKATADFDMARGDGKALQLHTANGKQPETIKVGKQNGWDLEIDYFLQCIQRRKKPTITNAADALQTVALLNAELESIQRGKTVKL